MPEKNQIGKQGENGLTDFGGKLNGERFINFWHAFVGESEN